MTCATLEGEWRGQLIEPDNVVETLTADWTAKMEEAINNGGNGRGSIAPVSAGDPTADGRRIQESPTTRVAG